MCPEARSRVHSGPSLPGQAPHGLGSRRQGDTCRAQHELRSCNLVSCSPRKPGSLSSWVIEGNDLEIIAITSHAEPKRVRRPCMFMRGRAPRLASSLTACCLFRIFRLCPSTPSTPSPVPPTLCSLAGSVSQLLGLGTWAVGSQDSLSSTWRAFPQMQTWMVHFGETISGLGTPG